MFLTDHQLRAMTGYVQHAAQIRWLNDNGFCYWVRGNGRPNVLIRHVEKKFSGCPQDGGQRERGPTQHGE